MILKDSKGRETKIQDNQFYNVIYKDHDKIRLDLGAYWNRPEDEFIGHDNCEGLRNGPRFYVSSLDVPSYCSDYEILRIFTQEEFEVILKKLI